jgi:DNA-binding NtrC family response regulator
VRFAPDARQALIDYSWPGNVREVKNLVERVTVLTEERDVTLAGLSELFPCLRAPGLKRNARVAAAGKAESLWDTERQIILDALDASGWNQSRAARSLGISRHHLRYRIGKYGIQVPDYAQRLR